MKQVFCAIILLCIGLPNTLSSEPVLFKFSAGTIENSALKSKMEDNISALLSEINRAANENTPLNLSNKYMEDEAMNRLNALWNNTAHFVCDKKTNVSKCLNDFQGYQIRSIPITIIPVDSSYTQSLNRELTISLNKNGVITGVRFAWNKEEDINSMLNFSGYGYGAEMRNRREMLKWMEDLVSYFFEKNIGEISKVFSDGSLLLKDNKVIPCEVFFDSLDNQYSNSSKNKKLFLSNLQTIFSREDPFDIDIDFISLLKHGTKKNIYGLTFHLITKSDIFSEKGWMFMLWDFNDPENIIIHVHTWQPDQVVAKDGVFTLDDFFIP